MHNQHQSENVENGERFESYTCPMHPDVRSGSPGMCPECGMRLVPARQKNQEEKTGGDFDKHTGHHTNIFKKKFWVSFVLSFPIVLYSEILETLSGYQLPAFPGSRAIPAVLASIIFFYGGWVFLSSAWRELKARMPGMMTLIALAITVAYAYSVWVTFAAFFMPGTLAGETLFWELATLITIMLLGHWLEMRAVSGAQGALKELSRLLPDTAEVLRNGKTETVALSDLRKGDFVLVRPGGRIPADGIVSDGASDVNESIATGESRPVSKKIGESVIAGTTNGDGSLKITVTKIGKETFLAGVMRLVAEAEASKSRLQILSDRAAFYLTIVAVAAGGATLAVWLAASDPAFAVSRMVAVLVIACPHALGLAIPLVASISTTKAARNGFLVRSRMALESARNIDVVLFDKTGTLTKGEFGIDRILFASGMDERAVLQYAASVNFHSEHPLARAMVREAKKQGIETYDAKNFERIPGKGVRGEIEGAEILVGSFALASERGATFPAALQSEIDALAGQGKTVNVVMRGGALLGAIALADVIREESADAINALKKAGVRTSMITGDSDDVALWVSRELGIDEYFSRVLPGQKSEKVKELQARGLKVAMVGDGVNDAPALAAADLGIAIGAGTNVAIESAGIILVRNDPRDIAKIIRLSKHTYRKMIQNLFWATGYNVAAIPLAAGILAFRGIFLEPAVAAILMSFSTVIVAANAALLQRQKL